MGQLTSSNKLIAKINSKLDKIVHANVEPIDHDVLWYNTTDNMLYVFDNNSWIATSATGEEWVYISDDNYDLLPSSEKLDPKKHYIIYTEGEITPTGITYTAVMTGTTKTFVNAAVTANSMVDIIGTATPSVGIWEINTSNGQFIINSSESENNVEFYYKIQQ